MDKTAKKGDTVVVDYTGKFDEGEVFDTSQGRAPIEFEVGSGSVISGFDQGVTGMKEGEQKTIKISPQEGYGEYQQALVQEVPLSLFPENMELKKGLMLKLKDPEGRVIFAKVVDVSGQKAKIDANHPLAGKNLNFELKLVKIR